MFSMVDVGMAFETDTCFVWQEYEVSWHCISGGSSYCNSYRWTTVTVNTRSFTANVTKYGTAYVFEITVLTSRGRGSPYQVSAYIPPFNGIPGNFACDITKDSHPRLECHWSPPTDFNPDGFNVSRKSKHGLNFAF